MTRFPMRGVAHKGVPICVAGTRLFDEAMLGGSGCRLLYHVGSALCLLRPTLILMATRLENR